MPAVPLHIGGRSKSFQFQHERYRLRGHPRLQEVMGQGVLLPFKPGSLQRLKPKNEQVIRPLPRHLDQSTSGRSYRSPLPGNCPSSEPYDQGKTIQCEPETTLMLATPSIENGIGRTGVRVESGQRGWWHKILLEKTRGAASRPGKSDRTTSSK